MRGDQRWQHKWLRQNGMTTGGEMRVAMRSGDNKCIIVEIIQPSELRRYRQHREEIVQASELRC